MPTATMEPATGQLPLHLTPRTRADQIFSRFVVFHRENPGIWSLFKQFTFRAIDRGFSHYSSDAILHQIRWHMDVEVRTAEPVKLNDDYTAYYARLFMVAYPQHNGFFELRRRKSAERSAYRTDLAVVPPEPATQEEALRRKLVALL